MSNIIQLLPDHVANQIAAGEVVQRPASVVKELLENAIDAKANNIQLIVKDAGRTLIQVIDDGIGMSVTDARMCFERHATSKIKNAEDLFQLNTKGFRGEALASIAAIAHIELKTKQEEDEIGTAICIEGSKVTSQEPTVVPTGTSLAVKNLFFNIPARRNFLKSNQVELRHITDEFNRVALAHPNVCFTFHHNASELFHLPIANMRKRITGIFGAKTNEKLVPVNEETEILNVSGFILKPEYAKKSRGEQFFFVNNRFIKSPYLHHAIVAAFEGLLKEKAHPSYFLFLEVDPKTIDINIHPTKTEIKFDNEHDLYALLKATVKHSLGMFNIAPVLDFERDNSLDTPYDYKEKSATAPTISVDSNFNPFNESTSKPKVTQKQHTYKPKDTGAWESLYIDTSSEDKPFSIPSEYVEQEEVTSSIFTDETLAVKKQPTFQFQNKYIITTIKSGLIAIHQQRAHERILFEEYLKYITTNEGLSQQLLFPLSVAFTTNDIVILEDIKEQLYNTGFIFEKKENTLVFSGLPSALKETEVQSVLEALIEAIALEVPEDAFSQNSLIAKLLAEQSAVRVGTRLDEAEQIAIVSKLFSCRENQLTPSNKKILTTIQVTDLDKALRL